MRKITVHKGTSKQICSQSVQEEIFKQPENVDILERETKRRKTDCCRELYKQEDSEAASLSKTYRAEHPGSECLAATGDFVQSPLWHGHLWAAGVTLSETLPSHWVSTRTDALEMRKVWSDPQCHGGRRSSQKEKWFAQGPEVAEGVGLRAGTGITLNKANLAKTSLS